DQFRGDEVDVVLSVSHFDVVYAPFRVISIRGK
ncbi:MAG: hypothetical protein RL422_557, partial [Bacteroidota bacterium]